MVSDTVSARIEPPPLSAGDFDAERGASSPEMRESAAVSARAGSFSGEWRRFVTGPMRSLTRRIVVVNLAGLGILVASVLYLNQLRSELIEVRVQSLEAQAQILATAIAEIAMIAPDEARFDNYAANEVLRQLTLQTGQRAQIYQSGRLTGDTRSFAGARSKVETRPLPPLEGASGLLGWIERLYSAGARALQKTDLPLYIETPNAGITEDAEVYKAQRGEPSFALRANSAGELIVSVAVPIRRLKVVMGVLVLSTEGGDIDRVIRAGRIEILRVFVVASAVSVLLSIVLASGIARPLRRLSRAAERAGVSGEQMSVPERVEIPDFTGRGDEIGDLSGAMRLMTDALYARIDAIESFAADVAHEIKNPLSSLRSAVETLDLAKTDASRERLYEVIREDVDRLDRLVTDISNASRLDAELVREARTSFDLGALAETMADVLQGEAEARDVRIVTEIPPAQLSVRGLESRIAQVLSNILGNGISFSPRGGELRLRVFRDDLNAAMVVVEDQGPGIPPDNLASIFERFYTERPAEEAFGRHSGLGLSISKQIVEAHGGTIRAENIAPREVEGEGGQTGARFIVRLPI